MRFLESLYFPRSEVTRVRANVPITEVAEVIISEYAYKGIHPNSQEPISAAVELAETDQNENIRKPLLDPQIIWHLEIWPVSLLRMTRIGRSPNDPLDLYALKTQCGKRFERFAMALRNSEEKIIEKDTGFQAQSERDVLPVLGIRGKLHNHIIGGHHRIIIAVWEGKSEAECLTAYTRLPCFRY